MDLQHALEDAISVEDPSLESQEFSKQLESAIGELNDPYRSIIIMRDIQGLSYVEIEQTTEFESKPGKGLSP